MLNKIKSLINSVKSFRKVRDLVTKEPNDSVLGSKIRNLFWKEKWNRQEK